VKTYSNVKDLTLTHRSTGTGMAFRKACSACGQHKEIRGGSVFTRLKLWRCAACTEKARGEA
jgi:hypothetical protein